MASRIEYDVVIVGLGLRGLSIAVQLIDGYPQLRLLILEREHHIQAPFLAHSANESAGSSFLQDLITLRNPRSQFTYVNFLHSQNLLLDFTNVSQFTPPRHLTQRYLSWTAEKVVAMGYVSFGSEVIQVDAGCVNRRAECWQLAVQTAQNRPSEQLSTKRLIMATGSETRIPRNMKTADPSRVVPLNNVDELEKKVSASTQPLHIAIVGASQEAVDLYERLYWRRGNHRVTLIFANQSLGPQMHDTLGQQNFQQNMQYPPEMRHKVVTRDNPPLRADSLEKLETVQYLQSMTKSPRNQQRFQLLAATEIIKAEDISSSNTIALTAKDVHTGSENVINQAFDYVVLSMERGPLRAERLLAIGELYDSRALTVDARYELNLRRRAVESDCGIWVPGALDEPTQKNDDLAAITEASERLLRSLVEKRREEKVISNDEVAML